MLEDLHQLGHKLNHVHFMSSFLAVKDKELFDCCLRNKKVKIVPIINHRTNILYETQKLWLQDQFLDFNIISIFLYLLVAYSSRLQYLRKSKILLLDYLCEMLEENLCLFVSHLKTKIDFYLWRSIVSFLNNGWNFIELIENSTLIYFLLFHEYPFHKANELKDIVGDGINHSNAIFDQYFLQAREQWELVLVFDVQKV